MYNVIECSGVATSFDKLTKGKIGFYLLSDPTTLLDTNTKISGNFGIAVRDSDNSVMHIGEVDLSGLRISKANYASGTTWSAGITFDSITVGKEYGFILTKHGCEPGERNKWHFSCVAKKANDCSDLIALVNAANLGITASKGSSAKALGLTCNDYTDYSIVSTDGTCVNHTVGKAPVLDAAWVIDQKLRGIANEGVNCPGENGSDLYKPFVPSAEKYTGYTLSFSTTRAAGRTTNTRIKQTVVICIAGENNTDLDVLFTITAPYSGGSIEGTTWEPEIVD